MSNIPLSEHAYLISYNDRYMYRKGSSMYLMELGNPYGELTEDRKIYCESNIAKLNEKTIAIDDFLSIVDSCDNDVDKAFKLLYSKLASCDIYSTYYIELKQKIMKLENMLSISQLDKTM